MNQLPEVNHKDYIIIVMSCDAYSDVWGPFASAWEKFWPNCPFNTYLISENQDFTHKLVKNIKTKKSMKWGEMLLYVLEKIDVPNIIYLQEDYILREPVNEAKVFELLSIFEKAGAAYLRLLPWPGPDRDHPKFPQVGLLDQESAYRTSLQAAVWKREVLQQLVKPSDDGSFESWSIERAKSIDAPFLCLRRNGISNDINHDGSYPLNYFATAVFQGKWLKEAVRLYKRLGIEVDTSQRGVMNRIDFLEYHERKKGTHHLKYKIISILKKVIDSIINKSFLYLLAILSLK